MLRDPVVMGMLGFALLCAIVTAVGMLADRRARKRMRHGSWVCSWCFARQNDKPMIMRPGWTQPVCDHCNELFNRLG